MNTVPSIRIRNLTQTQLNDRGDYVLYWMIAYRRGEHNFSLQRAVEWAKRLNKPLVILEALRVDYPWASDRLHRFIIEGMADNFRHFSKKNVNYYPYLETTRKSGKGLLKQMAQRACVVVSDDYPAFFLPSMLRAAKSQITVPFELVDSNGLLPLRAADKVFSRAFDLRRFLQKNLLPHLAEVPQPDPLIRCQIPTLKELPENITRRWPKSDPAEFLKSEEFFNTIPIDHSVKPGLVKGGSTAANRTLHAFLAEKLSVYDLERNQPEQEATSGLSPYLHFGHLSVHQVFEQLSQQNEWTPAKVAEKPSGSTSGWWGLSSSAESFLDELITWRELGFNMCWQRRDYDQYESLPEWARITLDDHASDRRQHVYSLEQFEKAETHDPLWNAAQRQLLREGRIHNYLRMLWGKKILEWSAQPREALKIMIELNNKYALDGRDPNSYSGIFWVLGRYDRAWGPERPIFGKVRYMSSNNTARKVKVKQYLDRYAPDKQQGLCF